MCGRYSLSYADLGAVVAALDAMIDPAAAELYRPRYNVAPSNAVVVARPRDDRAVLVPAVWGLRRDSRFIVNVRSESAASRFRGALQHGRCVVPADGFYEWTGEAKDRRPIWFHAEDGAPLLMAGLLDEGDTPAFAVLTAPARPPVDAIHDRMPVLLSREGARRWLLGGPTRRDPVRRGAPRGPPRLAARQRDRERRPRLPGAPEPGRHRRRSSSRSSDEDHLAGWTPTAA